MLKEHPISKYLVSEDGVLIVNPVTGYILKPTKSPKGYLKIGNYVCSSGTVHQAVYEAWCELVPKGLQINHKDGDKANNHISNLEAVTPRENTRHAYATGLAFGQVGEENPKSKLKTCDILDMYKMFEEGSCNKCVGDKHNVHERYVSLVRSGRRWLHLFKGPFKKSNRWKCSCRSATTRGDECTPVGPSGSKSKASS